MKERIGQYVIKRLIIWCHVKNGLFIYGFLYRAVLVLSVLHVVSGCFGMYCNKTSFHMALNYQHFYSILLYSLFHLLAITTLLCALYTLEGQATGRVSQDHPGRVFYDVK